LIISPFVEEEAIGLGGLAIFVTAILHYIKGEKATANPLEQIKKLKELLDIGAISQQAIRK